ncbi:MAG: hypothetical protein JW832_17245 [Deltaproteobacteria bacterium]|nr:hypothetical protein [Deltaproteobacteria bacterium]
MIRKTKINLTGKTLALTAEKAFKRAVTKVIEDHKQTGAPLAIWKDGKVVKVHPGQPSAHESKEEYTVKKQKSRGQGKHS